jgi:uncharacterized protein YcbK (DUF882 family)
LADSKGLARGARRTVVALVASATAVSASDAFASRPAAPHRLPAAVVTTPAFSPLDDDSLVGRSGKLRARLLGTRRTAGGGIRTLERLFGDSALRTPGVYSAPDAEMGRPFSLITLVPFTAKQRGRLGSYRIGNWPGERSPAFARKAPEGFIEVTASNQDTPVSENFRLRDFLTKDQHDVWPKYLVLREPLIDKLELVIEDLRSRGHNVTRMHVMSGFRTPQYNVRGVGSGGRAKDSRHQYGDAADVFVDSDGDGRMDDLNGDGRVDLRDARILLESVERVERRYPELVGGAGLYRANSAHGPFVHVDVRGSRARWG